MQRGTPVASGLRALRTDCLIPRYARMAPSSKSYKRAVLRTLFRFWRRGLACFVTIMTLAVIALYVCPREYISEAKVLVRLGRENVVLDPTATTGQLVS